MYLLVATKQSWAYNQGFCEHDCIVMLFSNSSARKSVSYSQYIRVFFIIGIFILLSRESDEALCELAWELPAICLPHYDGGIP